jgi:chorismate mutase/prephenate dehydratase
MDLKELRIQIDAIDREIVALLNRRTELASQIGRIKLEQGAEIYVPKREEEVFDRVTALSQGPLPPQALRAIYREIMSAAIALEHRAVVAYLGPPATYSHQAALNKFGASLDYLPLPSISDIFAAVERGDANYGVIPIENSTEGSVSHTLDMLAESELKIMAQIFLEIAHTLISRSPISEIRRVYSRDQALAQCRRWLQTHLPKAEFIEVPSTARAVQIASQEAGAAAIASSLAADLYQVPIVAPNIHDKADNTTRFFVMGRQSSGALGGGRDRTSLLLSVRDEPGGLLSALECFGKRGINLTKIESRPSKRGRWHYVFFVDCIGHHDDPILQEAIAELRQHSTYVKWLGSYPAGSGK